MREPSTHDVDLTGQAVLVVDDEPDIRLLIRTMLSDFDLPISVVEEAATGSEALETVARLGRKYETVVVVLDKQLPDLDGLEVARVMLERNPSELIILFTGYLTNEVREQAMRIGVASCVAKLAFETLPAVMAVLLAGTDASAAAVGTESDA